MYAMAHIQGSTLAPKLTGMVYFMDVPGGTDIYVEVKGLPLYKPGTDKTPPIGPHGFHIHETANCEMGDPTNPFAKASGHWNPTNQQHGNHSGDFPVLFSNNGYARMMFFTNKFKVSDIIGKAVVIHENPDDYRTQPAGASGKRIGCGVIKHSIYPLRPYI
jgi:Cu-Zn family superoxide dismutase